MVLKMNEDFLTLSEMSETLKVSKSTLRRWDNTGKLKAKRSSVNESRIYSRSVLEQCELGIMMQGVSQEPIIEKPKRAYKVLELFAGAGGLALGMEHAGLECYALNEIDKDACKTLRFNRPHWNILEGDISRIDFKPFRGEVDVVTGGFPCQAFSYAGKKLGLEDVRGTLFYEFARAVKETQPLIAVGENVRGLLNHNGGHSLKAMLSVLDDIGYKVITPRILKAIHYHVPQKRERLFIIAIRKDFSDTPFHFPKPDSKIYTLKDALKAGSLFKNDVPDSLGQKYPLAKKEVLDLVPPGGYWRDLPLEIQKSYMGKSFYLGGGKTGIARRISWDEPSLTLTCAPAQKQTERCHPEQTRPFTVREYARIQTFPDDWEFLGSLSSKYRQIGNAVPVNLARAVGQQIVQTLNDCVMRGE